MLFPKLTRLEKDIHSEAERLERRHKRLVHSVTTCAVLSALIIPFLTPDWQHVSLTVNVLANLWWIWVE